MLLNVSTVGINLINPVLSHFVSRTAMFCFECKSIAGEFGSASKVMLSEAFYMGGIACLPNTLVRTSP